MSIESVSRVPMGWYVYLIEMPVWGEIHAVPNADYLSLEMMLEKFSFWVMHFLFILFIIACLAKMKFNPSYVSVLFGESFRS